MREPTYRIENGKKIYSMECRIDAHRRPAPPNLPPPDINRQPMNNEAAPNAEGKPQAPADTNEDPDVVSVHVRVITADDAYPTMGWLGPQRVRYGHDHAKAIGEIPLHMANRPRPVPLMWNHTYDVEKKAGKLADGYWEESTDIKPGVNGWLRVNRKYDPKAALGLETGEIDATSVALVMDMERSHPDMQFDLFVDAAASGEEINGEPVAWLPYKLNDVPHHAMVWSGADPNSGPRAIATENWDQAATWKPGAPGTIRMQNETSGRDAASTETAAEAANNSNPRGGISVEQKALRILDSLSRDLGFDVALSEGLIPEELHAKLSKRVQALTNGTTRYTAIEARLSKMGEKYLPADSKAVAPLDILDALAPRLDLANHGEKYLSDLRAEALKAFDAAKTDPANKREQTASEKTIRGLIETAQDVEQLKGFFAEYDAQKAAKFGARADLHGTADEELPPVTPNKELTAEQRQIHASFERWNGGGK